MSLTDSVVQSWICPRSYLTELLHKNIWKEYANQKKKKLELSQRLYENNTQVYSD